MSVTTRLRGWWHQIWAKRLGWSDDPFPVLLEDLRDRLFIVEKRCSALMPTLWPDRKDH